MIWETHETRPSTISAVHRRVGTQNRENNPMQSRIGPDPAALFAALRPGHQKKVVRRHDPNLISSRCRHNAHTESAMLP